MNIFVLTALIALVIAIFGNKILQRIRRSYYAWFIPGPPVYLPIIYNGIDFLNTTATENFETICKIMNKYGPTFRVWLGSDLMVGTQDVELIEKVLLSPNLLTKSFEYGILSPWLNDGLLLSTGKKWSQRRKILTPAFHFSILDNYIEIFDNQTNTLVKNLEKFKNNESIQLENDLTLCALDIIFESTLGTNIRAQEPGSLGDEFAKTTKELDASLTYRIYNALLRIHLFWRFSSQKKRQDKLIKHLHSITTGIIREKRIKFNNSEATQTEFNEKTDVYGSKTKTTFLDILLETKVDGKPLSDVDIREEVDTFIFEGHDTTKSGLLFAIYNIAKYPQVQQKCFDEIKSVFGSDKTSPTTIRQLNSLKYLELVIKESLRLFPPVPMIGRLTTENVTLKNGLVVPEGTQLGIFLYALGRNPNFYSDPEAFKPERFETDEFKDRSSPFQYIPFAAGFRNCIGQKFAMLEVKTTISKMLRYYEVSLSEETINSELILTLELVLKPASVIEFHVNDRVY